MRPRPRNLSIIAATIALGVIVAAAVWTPPAPVVRMIPPDDPPPPRYARIEGLELGPEAETSTEIVVESADELELRLLQTAARHRDTSPILPRVVRADGHVLTIGLGR